MQLNGTQVASYAAPAWTAIQPFAIPAGSPFQAGTNTLTVVVDNSGGYGTGVQIAKISGTATSSVGGTGTMGGDGGATSTPNTTIIDPQWERTNEHFLAAFGPGPDLEYYPSNSYPLYNEDNAPAGAAFTWTSTETWNGPNGWGNGPIPGFIPDETWFYTYDRVGDGMTSTVYWFRANVDLGPKSALTSVTLSDKWHAGHITVNDGLIVFLNGARQQIMPCAPGGTPTYLSPSLGDDPSTGCPLDDVVYPTGPAFDGVSLPLSALQDGTNEIAVMYEEINGFGGLDHLVVTMTAAPAPSDD
jgi:hypothetical protein